MSKFNGLALVAALGLATIMPQTASADAKIYPYKTSQNYCPTGLQPVSINGVICCGTPNQHVSYQSAMSHPVAKKKVHKVHKVKRKTYHARADCPIGASPAPWQAPGQGLQKLEVCGHLASVSPFGKLVADLLIIREARQPRTFHGRDVYKHVIPARFWGNESKALCCVKPFDGSRWHRFRASCFRYFPL